MKNRPTSHSGEQPPKGIVMDSKGIGFTASGLPLADHFFQATSYRVTQVGSNLIMAFGAQTAFASELDTDYRLAIEIVFPVEVAARFLFYQNWKMNSVGSEESFAKAVEKAVEKDLLGYVKPKKYNMPTGSSFRSFPSNFSIMSLSTGQGTIEFFEAPPGVLVEAIYKKSGWRPNSDVRSILTVVLPPIELYQFLIETKNILEKVKIKNDGLEVENV